uniref:Uncharacterized protein n=1 Tax=Rhipicephalus appendiculatus TaxID=34631 RepID=A0A131YC30_RHIAP
MVPLAMKCLRLSFNTKVPGPLTSSAVEDAVVMHGSVVTRCLVSFSCNPDRHICACPGGAFWHTGFLLPFVVSPPHTHTH